MIEGTEAVDVSPEEEEYVEYVLALQQFEVILNRFKILVNLNRTLGNPTRYHGSYKLSREKGDLWVWEFPSRVVPPREDE